MGSGGFIYNNRGVRVMEINKLYKRDAIPALFGEEFNVGKWNSGHVTTVGGCSVLLVTLNKKGHIADYEDKLKAKHFTWSSQNSTTPTSKKGQAILQSKDDADSNVYLFVRKNKLGSDGKAAPFQALGTVSYISHKGEKPMSVNFKLNDLNLIDKEDLK